MEYLSQISDFVFAVVAVFSSLVAYRGLGDWYRQLETQKKFEVAVNLLEVTNLLVSRIDAARNRYVEDIEISSTQKEYESYVNEFNNRYAPIWKALASFEYNMIKAEILLGSSFKNNKEEVMECIHTLRQNVRSYLKDMEPEQEHKNTKKGLEEPRRIVFNFGEDDSFGDELNKPSSSIKEDLKKIIKYK